MTGSRCQGNTRLYRRLVSQEKYSWSRGLQGRVHQAVNWTRVSYKHLKYFRKSAGDLDVVGKGVGTKFFLKVFSNYIQKHLLLANAVFNSYPFIPQTHFGKVWGESITMVTRYDIISSMRSSHFLIKKEQKCISYFKTLPKNVFNFYIFSINLIFFFRKIQHVDQAILPFVT